jgi:phosphatidylserine/phosphatidylglycerophosphate/cardiolipin synthase-like enzyme
LHSLLPCLPSLPPSHPPTPLLTTTSNLLATAEHFILLITPNVTAPSVLALLLAALHRGVEVRIWTNKNLMTLEQWVTAGSTTPRCLAKLERQAKEQGAKGTLRVRYFDDPSEPGGRAAGAFGAGQKAPSHVRAGGEEWKRKREERAVKLHAKVMVVDGARMLLGSGNMDAASWGTSQELGVLIEGREVVEGFMGRWPFGDLQGEDAVGQRR